jgi:hypothetical protein
MPEELESKPFPYEQSNPPPEDTAPVPTILDTSDQDPEGMMFEIFRQGAAQAAEVIVQTALNQEYGTGDRLRYDAARYVVDRVMGKIMGYAPMGAEDPYDRFARKVTEEAEESAKKPPEADA